MNGVLYQWEEILLNPGDGDGFYNSINNEGFLTLVINESIKFVNIQFPNAARGISTFNGSSTSTEGFSLILRREVFLLH